MASPIKIKISMKMKILSLLIFLLLISVGSYVFFAIDMFYSDKESYIYETSLTRAESLSELTLGTVNNSSKDSISLALVSKTNPDQLQNLLNSDPNILMFSAFKNEAGQFKERIRVVNDTLWNELEEHLKKKKSDLIELPLEKILPPSLPKDENLSLTSSTNVLTVPTITMIVPSPGGEFYVCLLSINKIIDQFKKDKVYVNELLDLKGRSYLSQTSRPDLMEIIKSNIPKGTKDLILRDKTQNLVSFVKIPALNMAFFTMIDKEKAFFATKSLMKKSLYFGILLLAISVFLGVLFSASITHPINTLVKGTQHVARGEFNKRIKIKTNDELGILSASFNFMSREINTLLKSKEIIINELEKAKIKLEDYSKNLEEMVAQRTIELKEANDFLDTMINSLDQGLMVFGKDNICHDVYTKACVSMFDKTPAGIKFNEVIGVTGTKESETFEKWSRNLFDERLPFEHLTPLGPKFIQEGEDFNAFDFKYIGLQYFPMRNEEKKVENVVAVATDKTAQIQAQEAFKEQEAYVNMILKLVNNKKQFASFIEEFKSLSRDMIRFLDGGESGFNTDGILICLHSMKGGAGLFSIKSIQEMAHQYENEVIEVKDKSNQERVAFIPRLQEMIQELSDSFQLFLMESKEFLGGIIDDQNKMVEVSKIFIDKFNETLSKKNDEELLSLYHDYFIKEPIINHFSAYGELVKDISERLGKDIAPIKFEGGETRIELAKHKELFNVLVHAFRNSVDHGIESSDERVNSGKSSMGHIFVKFVQDSENLNIEISDDGRGIDPNRIREKLDELGISSKDKHDDKKVLYHIFDSEFSTSTDVTEISGRGVGMSAIKEAIDKVGGKIIIDSQVGRGTVFKFSVPA